MVILLIDSVIYHTQPGLKAFLHFELVNQILRPNSIVVAGLIPVYQPICLPPWLIISIAVVNLNEKLCVSTDS